MRSLMYTNYSVNHWTYSLRFLPKNFALPSLYIRFGLQLVFGSNFKMYSLQALIRNGIRFAWRNISLLDAFAMKRVMQIKLYVVHSKKRPARRFLLSGL